MAAYDFLRGVVVLEVAQLGMDALGGYLADMGARVVKVEALPDGDPVRFAGEKAIGGPNGVGLLHLRWNRGKQSVAIDLKAPEGRDLFRRMARKADVVIDGLKGGALDRLGIGSDVLRAENPALVFCSMSGLGLDGPYHSLRSHAVAYDAFAGLLPGDVDAVPPGSGEFKAPSIGMNAPGLYAAVGVLSALLRARSTGEGAFIEVAAADCSAHWLPEGIDAEVNAAHCQPREGFADRTGRMMHWPRLWHYAASDGQILLLEALSWPTWVKFCKLLGRDDLLTLHEGFDDDIAYAEALREEIAAVIRTRTRDEWMALLTAHDVSAMPVNDAASLARDPHYLARGNWYDASVPGVGTLRLSGTPIRVVGSEFSPPLAPALGEHRDVVLGDIAGLDDEAIAVLRASGIVG